MDGIEVRSAGTNPEAECPVGCQFAGVTCGVRDDAEGSSDILRLVQLLFKRTRRLFVWDPDVYSYMQPELVALLRRR